MIVSNLWGQLSYSPDPVIINVPVASDYEKIDINLNVANDTAYTIYWKFDFPESFKQGWQVQLCDNNLCYDFNAPESDRRLSRANNIGSSNPAKWELGFHPNGVEGSGQVTITLYGDNNFIRVVKTMTVYLNSGVSSAKDFTVANLKVFPNPTANYFQIANGNAVKKIIIYNVLGKEVKTFFHYPNAQHDVAELRKGIYMVRMFDSKNRVIKTVRLSKQGDGA